MQKLRLALVHEDSGVRARLRQIAESEPDIAVVGEAGDAQAAAELAAGVAAGQIVFFNLPEAAAPLRLTGIISKRQPSARVILSKTQSGDSWIKDALTAGARGIIEPPAEPVLLDAVRSVAQGNFWFSAGIRPLIDRMLLEELVRQLQQQASGDSYQSLTPREREIMSYMVQGKTSKEIANMLALSVYTVDTHRSRIFQKLNLHSVADLILYGLRRGAAS
jgi:two-component system, NarL family, response regulator NreC